MGNVCFDSDKIARKEGQSPIEKRDSSLNEDPLPRRDSKISEDNQSSYSAMNMERMSGFDNLRTDLQTITKIFKRDDVKAEGLIEITKGDKALQVYQPTKEKAQCLLPNLRKPHRLKSTNSILQAASYNAALKSIHPHLKARI
jgi:hypothetical protein